MKLVCIALGLLLSTGSLFAQAAATAEQGVRLFTYGTASAVRPNSTDSIHNRGFTLGATANLFHVGRAEFGLDVRDLFSTGALYRENVFAGGPRVQFDFGRYQPYAAFHLGEGSLTFKHPAVASYTEDNSTVYGTAAGLDYRLGRSWALRGEAEYQRWKLGSATPVFYPLSVSVGVRYQFHLRNAHGPE